MGGSQVCRRARRWVLRASLKGEIRKGCFGAASGARHCLPTELGFDAAEKRKKLIMVCNPSAYGFGTLADGVARSDANIRIIALTGKENFAVGESTRKVNQPLSASG